MRHVVVIEDDEGIGFSLRLALEDRGYDVLVYSDPVTVPYDSLEADIILVDYFMPKMDGEQAIELLRRNPRLRHSTIFLMSATPNLAQKAHALGVHYLEKPFDLNSFYQRIEEGEGGK